MTTQKDTQFPILSALLTLGKDGTAIAVLRTAVFSELGLGEGTEKEKSAFSNGGMDLRERGCVASTKEDPKIPRGVWRITPAGEKAFSDRKVPAKPPAGPKPAKKVPAEVVEAYEPSSDPVFAQATDEVEAAPTLSSTIAKPVRPETTDEIATRLANGAEKPKRRLSLIEPALEDGAPAWMADSYLRTLVVANTPCFGSFSTKAAVCRPCDLKSHCQVAQAAALSILASVLKEEAAKKSKLTTGAFEKTHEAVANAFSPSLPRTPGAETAGKPMKATFDGVCARTGDPIPKGESCYYVHGEGLVSERGLEVPVVLDDPCH